MANYKVGQILTAKKNYKMKTFSGSTIHVPVGNRIIVGADKYVHHFSRRACQPLPVRDTVKGYDSKGIAEWIYRFLAYTTDGLDDALLSIGLTSKDFQELIQEALEEIGFDEEV